MSHASSSSTTIAEAVPPTTYLLPIKSLSDPQLDIPRLEQCLAYLRHIYVPHIRGSRRRKPKSKPSNTSSSSSSLSSLRRDPFERSYALRWLSALIRLPPPEIEIDSQPNLAELQTNAAALLAICAGTAAQGKTQRHFDFDEGKIQIVLNDVPLSTDVSVGDGDYFGSVGAQTWGGACVLAEEIADNPGRFFVLPGNGDGDEMEMGIEMGMKTFHVLELGAGTGLVSLVAGKVATKHMHCSRVEVIATDYFPSVLENLKANIDTNFTSSSSTLVSSQFLDWSLFSNGGDDSLETFDLILGADIIYESLHASWVREVVEKVLRRPAGRFHLVIPLRPSFAAESSTIEKEFKFVGTGDSRSSALVILSREIIICDTDDSDSGEEEAHSEQDVVQYAYYVIGWEGR